MHPDPFARRFLPGTFGISSPKSLSKYCSYQRLVGNACDAGGVEYYKSIAEKRGVGNHRLIVNWPVFRVGTSVRRSRFGVRVSHGMSWMGGFGRWFRELSDLNSH